MICFYSLARPGHFGPSRLGLLALPGKLIILRKSCCRDLRVNGRPHAVLCVTLTERYHLGREDIATRFDVRAEFVRLPVGSDCRSETCRRREAPVRRRGADRRFELRLGLYSLRMFERPRRGNEHSPGDGPAFERRSVRKRRKLTKLGVGTTELRNSKL